MTQTDQQNVPKLRFPGFEGAWEAKKLGDLGAFKSGVGFPETEQGGTTGVPFYKVSDMNIHGNEAVMTTANNYVTDEQVVRLKLKPINTHAVIFAKVGAAIFLERKRQAKDFLLDNNMMAFIPGDRIGKEYLGHLFSVLRLSKFAQVGALPSYSGSDLATIKLSLPALSEQRKIAAFLSAVDEKIAQLTRKKALLEEYRKGCMQQLFTQKIRFKDDQGNDFPDWEFVKAGDLFANHSDKEHDGTLPLLAITQDQGVALRDSIEKDIRVSDAGILGYKVVKPGDFVISLRSFQGGIEFSKVEGICSPAYTILRSNRPVQGRFFQHFFKTADFIKRLSATTIGIREGKQISYSAFSTLKLPLPLIEEQTRIADFIDELDKKIELAGIELH